MSLHRGKNERDNQICFIWEKHYAKLILKQPQAFSCVFSTVVLQHSCAYMMGTPCYTCSAHFHDSSVYCGQSSVRFHNTSNKHVWNFKNQFQQMRNAWLSVMAKNDWFTTFMFSQFLHIFKFTNSYWKPTQIEVHLVKQKEILNG